MQPRYIFLTIFFIIIFGVTIGFLATGSIPASIFPAINSLSGAQETPVEDDEVKLDTGALTSKTIEPAALQDKPPRDGLSLLENHCAQCHVAQWIKQVEKPRWEWEKTLAQMEEIGVQLSDNEKLVLLDYLTNPDAP